MGSFSRVLFPFFKIDSDPTESKHEITSSSLIEISSNESMEISSGENNFSEQSEFDNDKESE